MAAIALKPGVISFNSKWTWAWLGGAAAWLLLHAWRLGTPGQEVFDEFHYVRVARGLLTPGGDIGQAHPLLGLTQIAWSIRLLGDNPAAWRISSLMFGFGVWVLVALLAYRLTGRQRAAALAAFLWSLDGIALVQARLGLMNSPLLFGMLAAVLFLLPSSPHESSPPLSGFRVAASGVMFGLAMAVKWSALPGFIPCIALLMMRSDRKRFLSAELAGRVALWTAAVIVIYFASFWLVAPFNHFGWKRIIDYQSYMLNFHFWKSKPHPYASAWWSWPLLLRPVWYYFLDGVYRSITVHGSVRGLIGLGNPMIYLAFPLGLAISFLNRSKKTDYPSWVRRWLLISFFGNWLPCALLSRVMFIHYFYPASVFALLALVLALDNWWERGGVRSAFVFLYLVLTVGMFLFWYPLWSACPVSRGFYEQHLWLTSWKRHIASDQFIAETAEAVKQSPYLKKSYWPLPSEKH
jgi:dolichyl-phosphate-mannose--protein O-mannosyl transferase